MSLSLKDFEIMAPVGSRESLAAAIQGDHYHLTVFSDWDENVFVDTNDVWDDGDRVGITIPPDAIRVIKITD